MTDHASRQMFRRIWSLAWPTVVYNLLEMSLGMADLLMVRSFGQEATAAIGLNRQVTFLVEAAALAISTGVITLVSQGVGSRDRAQIEGTVRQSLSLVFLLGPLTMVAGYLASRRLLVLMHATPETILHGVPYLRVYFLGIIFLWVTSISAAILRGAGDAMTPLKLALGVSLVNIVLNYIFIFGAGPVASYEVMGAAMGTVAARAIGAVAYLALLLRGRGEVRLRLSPRWELDWVLIRRILRVGLPTALAGVLRSGARLVFLGIVGTSVLGVSIHAAVGVGLQVRLLSILPALAFQVATATLVGQAIGRGDIKEAEQLAHRSTLLLAVLMTGVVGLTIVFARPLAAVFIVDEAAAALGAQVLRWFAVAQFFSSLSICTQGALAGAGDTQPFMRYTLATQVVIMLALTYLLMVVAGLDPVGALVAWTVAPAIQLVLMQARFRSGRWKTMRV